MCAWVLSPVIADRSQWEPGESSNAGRQTGGEKKKAWWQEESRETAAMQMPNRRLDLGDEYKWPLCEVFTTS